MNSQKNNDVESNKSWFSHRVIFFHFSLFFIFCLKMFAWLYHFKNRFLRFEIDLSVEKTYMAEYSKSP